MNTNRKIKSSKIANKKSVHRKKGAGLKKAAVSSNPDISTKKQSKKSNINIRESISPIKFDFVSGKIYPQIYSYIYEREPEDMAKIYEEHKNAVEGTKQAIKKISGFKIINNKLVAITSNK